MKNKLQKLETTETLFIILTGIAITFIALSYIAGGQNKVNKLCNKYQGNLPFCQVETITYKEVSK